MNVPIEKSERTIVARTVHAEQRKMPEVVVRKRIARRPVGFA